MWKLSSESRKGVVLCVVARWEALYVSQMKHESLVWRAQGDFSRGRGVGEYEMGSRVGGSPIPMRGFGLQATHCTRAWGGGV